MQLFIHIHNLNLIPPSFNAYENELEFIVEMPVPIAIIVCEGDMESIAHVAGSLKNKLPVIIIKGSGKAADLILDFLEK